MKYLERINSTNDYVKEHLEELDDFECVFTMNQFKGKGRTGHTWESEPYKNIALSILIKDDKITKKFGLVSIVVSLVVAEYLERLGMEDVSIKWPNDVYVKGKKICGILCEGSLPKYMVVGVGINVNQTNFGELNATSIKNELDFEIDPKLVAVDIVDAFKYRMTYLGDDLAEAVEEYCSKDYLLNKTISFMRNGEELIGIAKGIDFDGSLKVLYNDTLINVSTNEVNIVRKA
ncbi:MAG: biotin--[acetyl-CoA-carboxylase] ligase [Bacilli bacterium]|nr:biotin--[acetyl-CoA-carboxylase] ligase [Bacilli bacterium]